MAVAKLGNEREPVELARGVLVRRVTRSGFRATCPDCTRKLEAPTIERLRYLYREHRHHIHQEEEA